MIVLLVGEDGAARSNLGYLIGGLGVLLPHELHPGGDGPTSLLSEAHGDVLVHGPPAADASVHELIEIILVRGVQWNPFANLRYS